MNKIDISLINMPSTEPRPSLSLGLLKGILKRDGFKAKVVYGNLLFLEEFGMDFFKVLFQERNKSLVDWIFMPLVFPEYKENIEGYIKFLLRNRMFYNLSPSQLKEQLLYFRNKAQGFLIELVEEILKDRPEIIGCTSNFLQYIPSLALLKSVKNIAPEIITLMGGPNCETELGITTHKIFPWVDYIVSGDGDDIISPLVTLILEKKREIPEEECPPGVFGPVHRQRGYPEEPALILSTKNSLKGLPPPDYDDYFETLNKLDYLKELLNPSLSFESSRGCWWGEKHACKFCGENGVRYTYRKKPVKEVLYELEFLSKRYGINRFLATDNIMDMESFKTLLPEIVKIGQPYKFYYSVKSNLKRDQIKLLSESGVVWLQPGIESLDSRILSLMNKGVASWQNINLLKWCLYYGICAMWSLLYDVPGEEDSWYEDMAKIIPLLIHFQPPKLSVPVHFCRNSIYYNKAEEHDLHIVPGEVYSYTLPLSEDKLNKIAFYFDEKGQVEKEADEMNKFLYPGLNLVNREIFKWRRIFWSDNRTELKMNEYEGNLEIKDSRPCAVKNEFLLTGPDRDIYLACDEGISKNVLLDKFKKDGIKEIRIEETLEKLIHWKILIYIDGHFLSLAIRETVKRLPPDEENPVIGLRKNLRLKV